MQRRHTHRPMSENAIGYLLNRAGYHGNHVPHGFRAAFSTIMNEWCERHGKEHDRKVIDLMLAHVLKEKVEGVYNRAAYMPRRRELAGVWSEMLSEGLSDPAALVERPAKEIGAYSRRRYAESSTICRLSALTPIPIEYTDKVKIEEFRRNTIKKSSLLVVDFLYRYSHRRHGWHSIDRLVVLCRTD